MWFEVEKFDGSSDFGIWKHKMLCALEILSLASDLEEATDLDDASEKTEPSIEAKVDPKKVMKDKRVLRLIQ